MNEPKNELNRVESPTEQGTAGCADGPCSASRTDLATKKEMVSHWVDAITRKLAEEESTQSSDPAIAWQTIGYLKGEIAWLLHAFEKDPDAAQVVGFLEKAQQQILKQND